jgi:hypothetical protein
MFAVVVVTYSFFLAPAFAAEGAPAEAPAVQNEAAESADEAPVRSSRRAKGKNFREKETEGTKAANRFESKNVIESSYKLNGESLEVDPD